VGSVSKGAATRKGEVYVKPVRLSTFRKLANLSQAGLAAKATLALAEGGDIKGSVSESLVALIETGRRQPSLRNASALATALGVPLDALADVKVPAEDEDEDAA
jgi:transcriptional regulator with XRE-family HTH domain